MLTVENAKELVRTANQNYRALLASQEWPLVQVNAHHRKRMYPAFPLTEEYCEAMALLVVAYLNEEDREDVLAVYICSKRKGGYIISVPKEHEDRLYARRLLAKVKLHTEQKQK